MFIHEVFIGEAGCCALLNRFINAEIATRPRLEGLREVSREKLSRHSAPFSLIRRRLVPFGLTAQRIAWCTHVRFSKSIYQLTLAISGVLIGTILVGTWSYFIQYNCDVNHPRDFCVMTLDDFLQSLTASEPPLELSPALAGLWWEAKGDWTHAQILDKMRRSGKNAVTRQQVETHLVIRKSTAAPKAQSLRA